MKINPYIHFPGNAEEAFNFYQLALGGEIIELMRFKDMGPNPNIQEHELNKIAHIALNIGPDQVLMGSDVPKFMGDFNLKENRSKITVSTNSKDESDRIYEILSNKGEIEMPIGDSPWGSYFAMFRDQFGIEWMIEFRYQ
ncbi:MAG: hypothetical protein RIR51_1278 [Bacteroidota bacterium]